MNPSLLTVEERMGGRLKRNKGHDERQGPLHQALDASVPLYSFMPHRGGKGVGLEEDGEELRPDWMLLVVPGATQLSNCAQQRHHPEHFSFALPRSRRS